MADQPIAIHHVASEQVGLTLVSALRQWRPDESWNRLRHLIRGRRVQLNGNLIVDEGRRLTAGDVVRILPQPQPAPPSDQDVKLRYLDDQVVVVEKPSGMTTVRHSEELDWPGRRRQLQPTLDELLPKIIARRQKQRSSSRRPTAVRAVHRIDRDTSGLLVFARTVPAERSLVSQFRAHSVHRRYLAVVEGAVVQSRIESRLVRDRGDGRRGSSTDDQGGQSAITHVHPLERLGEYTLIECRLETGRTHQIRIHLSESGHRVCGERVYTHAPYQPELPDTSGSPRLALHAAELGFLHPTTSEYLHFVAPLPNDLGSFVERLRSSRDR